VNAQRNVGDKIRDFVLGHFPLAQQRRIADDASLIEQGIIDSLGILEVVTFIESEFGLTLSDDEMITENFESIKSLTEFVAARQGVDTPVPAEI